MKRMLNEAAAFREEMVDGFVAAYGRHVRRVPGASGIVAVGAPRPGKVSVVVGGGSGHYPAFYGLVGRGLADAGVIGDVFTSPSGEQAYRVARAADGGAGILFTFGNYSGDVLNFGMAETRLRAEGIDARTVLVTDDVLSAPKDEADRRRGIAGGFYVFKTAGASATRGDDLATVEALTRRANARVRTAGVAFAGCTIPGQEEPLFTVPAGQMEVGLGIHGEPGVRTVPQVPSREIARLLVDTLLADAPADAGSRAAVLVNGLGGTKYEEMFVLYQAVAPLLAAAGIEAYEPQIGEFVTSLDMAGCSLTLFWLDDDLRALHDATAVTPAYTRLGPDAGDTGAIAGAVGAETAAPVADTDGGAAGTVEVVDRVGIDGARDAIAAAGAVGAAGSFGVTARAALGEVLRAIEATEAELGRLDAAAGDGDHGLGMARGFRAAVDAVDGFGGPAGATFVRAGTAFMDAAGGASGALVGAWLTTIGSSLPASDDAVDAAAFAAALAAALAAVPLLGQAAVGDKTLVDTLAPFGEALDAAVGGGATLPEAWAAALPAAEAGMRSTEGMVSRRGRASRLGERSRGHVDAGATSMFYVLRAMGDALREA